MKLEMCFTAILLLLCCITLCKYLIKAYKIYLVIIDFYNYLLKHITQRSGYQVIGSPCWRQSKWRLNQNMIFNFSCILYLRCALLVVPLILIDLVNAA